MKIGFNTSNTNVKNNIIFPKDFTNGIVFGRTGSGKTSCVILPNIEPVEGQMPPLPKMNLLIMSVTYVYQTFINGEQVSLTKQIPFKVGLCR